MTQAQRKIIWLKYNKHCCYCGQEIKYKEMQVDHKHPQHLAHWTRNDIMVKKYDLPRDINAPENLMPSCRRCNHYKRGQRLETFRRTMRTLHKRIQEHYINKVALDYGIITLHTWDGLFYFERIENGSSNSRFKKN